MQFEKKKNHGEMNLKGKSESVLTLENLFVYTD